VLGTELKISEQKKLKQVEERRKGEEEENV